MSFILSPSQNLFYLGSETPGYTFSSNLLAAYNHKKLAIYDIFGLQQLLKEQKEIPKVTEVDFNKKVEALSFADQNVVVSDKYGDVFLVTKDAKTFLNQNFAIPSMIQYVKAEKDKVFIVGDEYSKLKVFNFENPHEIFSIWTPVEATPLQMVIVGDTIVYLVRISKKDTVECRYSIYTFGVSEIKSEQFPGKIFSDFDSEFSDNHLCKILASENNIFVVSLRLDTIIVNRLEYKGGLVKKEEIRASIGKSDWSYLDIAYQKGLFIFVGREGGEGPQEQHSLPPSPSFQVVSSTQSQYLLFFKI